MHAFILNISMSLYKVIILAMTKQGENYIVLSNDAVADMYGGIMYDLFLFLLSYNNKIMQK